MNDNDKIKQSFENGLPKKAPLSLWNNIAPNLPSNLSSETEPFVQKIKKSFEEQAPKPIPTRVWQAIEKQLNINTIWSKIQTALQQNQHDRKRAYYQQYKAIARWTGIAACLLLFWRSCLWETTPNLPSSTFANHFEKSSNKNNTTFSNFTTILNKSNVALIDSTTTLANSTTTLNNSNVALIDSTTTLANSTTTLNKSNVALIDSTTTLANSTTTLNNSNIALIDSTTTLANSTTTLNNSNVALIDSTITLANSTTTLSDFAILQTLPNPLLDNEKTPKNFEIEHLTVQLAATKPKRKLRFEVGTLLNTHTSLLLNAETSNSFSSTSLISTNLSTNTNIALSVVCKFNKRHALEVDFYPTMRLTQEYERFSKEGKLVQNKLDFRYYQIDALYQITFHQYRTKRGIKGQLVAKLGSNLSHLRQWSEQKSGQTTKYKPRYLYDAWNIGTKLAIGQHHQWKCFVVDYGIYGELGLYNIFKGDDMIPSNFLRTKTFNLGAYLAVRYAF